MRVSNFTNAYLASLAEQWHGIATNYRQFPNHATLSVRDPLISADRLDHLAGQMQSILETRTYRELITVRVPKTKKE